MKKLLTLAVVGGLIALAVKELPAIRRELKIMGM